MNMRMRLARTCGLLLLAFGLVWACVFDDTLREYLSAKFWSPFAKKGASFEKPNVRRISAPFAGMAAAQGDTALAKLRAAYQQLSHPDPFASEPQRFDVAAFRQAVAAARTERKQSRRDSEEIDLIEAKIDLRAGEPGEQQLLESARDKLTRFLRTARTPEFLSEGRGWLARVHFLLGNQTAAGKIYLDELNHNGSNLSRETVLNSLRMTYGYDGGPELRAHLEDYFDTPEHGICHSTGYQSALEPRPLRAAVRARRRRITIVRAHPRVAGKTRRAAARGHGRRRARVARHAHGAAHGGPGLGPQNRG